jgi:hypothetical protein
MSTDELTLKKIIAISGQPGLFKYVSQSRNGIIVESLSDQKRMNASASAKVSSLGDIAIYTETGEVALKEVFKTIRDRVKDGGAIIDPKSSNEELKGFLGEVLPDYDHERVYASDIKKMLIWFNLLNTHDLLNLIDIEEEKAPEVDAVKEEKTE